MAKKGETSKKGNAGQAGVAGEKSRANGLQTLKKEKKARRSTSKRNNILKGNIVSSVYKP